MPHFRSPLVYRSPVSLQRQSLGGALRRLALSSPQNRICYSSVLFLAKLLAWGGGVGLPVGDVVAVVGGDLAVQRFAQAIGFGRPEVNVAGRILRM